MYKFFISIFFLIIMACDGSNYCMDATSDAKNLRGAEDRATAYLFACHPSEPCFDHTQQQMEREIKEANKFEKSFRLNSQQCLGQ